MERPNINRIYRIFVLEFTRLLLRIVKNTNVERHLWIKSKASTCLNAFGRRIYWSSCRALKVVRQDSENHRGKLTILAIIIGK